MYGGNLAFKIDWASLILGTKFTVFLCFTLYLREISKYNSPTPPPVAESSFKKIIITIRKFLRGWVGDWTGGEGFNEKPKKRIGSIYVSGQPSRRETTVRQRRVN